MEALDTEVLQDTPDERLTVVGQRDSRAITRPVDLLAKPTETSGLEAPEAPDASRPEGLGSRTHVALPSTKRRCQVSLPESMEAEGSTVGDQLVMAAGPAFVGPVRGPRVALGAHARVRLLANRPVSEG